MKYVPLLWTAFWRKPARTILTWLSIVVAFTLFGLSKGITQGLHHLADESHAGRLHVLSGVGLSEALPIGYESRIGALPGIRGVTHISYFNGHFQDRTHQVSVYATDPGAIFPLYRELVVSPKALESMAHIRSGMLVGAQLAKRYGWSIGDHIPIQSSTWIKTDGTSNWTFEIVGVFDDPVDRSNTLRNVALVNFVFFDEARVSNRGTVNQFVVLPNEENEATRVAGSIDKLFANSADETRTQRESEIAQARLQKIGDVDSAVNGIVSAAIFALVLLIANTMMQSVRERTREFGILKAVGFPNFTVTALIVIESLFMCLSASVSGLLLAILLFPTVSSMLVPLRMPRDVLFLAIIVAAALSVACSLVPAWQVNKLKVVDAIRDG